MKNKRDLTFFRGDLPFTRRCKEERNVMQRGWSEVAQTEKISKQRNTEVVQTTTII